jgi:carbonic anhydrase
MGDGMDRDERIDEHVDVEALLAQLESAEDQVVDDLEQEDMGAVTPQPCTHDRALALLALGNESFVRGVRLHEVPTSEWRESLVHEGQHPYAVVVTCSDARVQPSIIFNARLGDLFVIRTVGGFVDSVAEASVEYGVGHLGAPLVVVLGHTHCGLVQAAIDGHADGVVRTVADQVSQIIDGEQDPRQAERVLVRAMIARLLENPTVARLVALGSIEVRGAIYDMASGHVHWMHG